ncbi:DUF5060 domain-containing protein [Rhodocytophaga aerolata]|uniref:DUF5060 domain-containing protein n=1 Tax=Rhodocytophaga aerolata TaxID=455078 RepID=A0ABT8R8P5_9BACT|nr:DUF5060 domain-containing protein [Rhodocytophaga aerolata]MDO1447729.1 DUF5060 domain-containing protein [Rhodocytophaga aerolata]
MVKYINLFLCFVCIATHVLANNTSGPVSKPQPAKQVEVYDFLELSFSSKTPVSYNPFTEVTVEGKFTHQSGEVTQVQGFCDSQEGEVHKIRFMPTKPGRYSYQIIIHREGKKQAYTGNFQAVQSGRHGPLRVDEENPWHFKREGSGEHFFWNSTTTYWMLGWKEDAVIINAIDRLAALKVNRIRVAINGRQDDGSRWSEPMVKESDKFTFMLNPWVAERPADLDNPGFDVSRFNVSHWQKLDNLVRHARDKGIVVSLIFYVDGLDHGCDPFKKANMGNADEQRYYQYAVARYWAFENVMWDVTNEYHLFRSEEWVEKMGTLLKAIDPAKHLISVHGHADFPFRKSPWVDVVLYQSWDECGGYAFITSCRQKQAETGRILPQVNEEYGYEDHYPEWGCGANAKKVENGRSADNRRQLAWEIYMAGGYQTTGERANDGTGAGADTGGGWINGRGNDSMTMLQGYGYITVIFSKVAYWKMNPHPELVNYGNLCLAEPGQQYLIYSRLPYCRVNLEKGQSYQVTMMNPRTGEETRLPDVQADQAAWQYPKELSGDWAFIIQAKN